MEIVQIVLEFIKVLIWPITTLIILFRFKQQFIELLNRIKKAQLPGGLSFETFPEQLEEAKSISQIVTKEKEEKEKENQLTGKPIPLNKVNARMLELELAPSPSGLELNYYRELALQDPVLALAGLRIELETMLKNLAKGYNISFKKREPIRNVVRQLRANVAITENQYNLIDSIFSLTNSAVHGTYVTYDQANDILDSATILRDYFVSWLSWGFPKK